MMKPCKDHESMQMMDHMHHSEHHSSAPVGTTGNMHHMGWMVSVKQTNEYEWQYFR